MFHIFSCKGIGRAGLQAVEFFSGLSEDRIQEGDILWCVRHDWEGIGDGRPDAGLENQ